MDLNIQDLAAILGPIGVVIGFMWYHFNRRFDQINERFEKIENKIDSKKNI